MFGMGTLTSPDHTSSEAGGVVGGSIFLACIVLTLESAAISIILSFHNGSTVSFLELRGGKIILTMYVETILIVLLIINIET